MTYPTVDPVSPAFGPALSWNSVPPHASVWGVYSRLEGFKSVKREKKGQERELGQKLLEVVLRFRVEVRLVGFLRFLAPVWNYRVPLTTSISKQTTQLTPAPPHHIANNLTTSYPVNTCQGISN
ncbi:hypothetical protein VTJ04DRAFT_9882 [Mycothermus thermophilus]|uniref:uncharacterized protein n=1 Tax=Humicola insolens TaxID=85995 RepID=UPI0037449503